MAPAKNGNDGPIHNCGLAGFYFIKPAPVSYLLPPLSALNHRGQEGLGLVGSLSDDNLFIYKKAGVVRDHIKTVIAHNVRVQLAIGHDRYSTSGSLKSWQPFGNARDRIITAHNGNIANPLSLCTFIHPRERRVLLSDTHIIHKAL